MQTISNVEHYNITSCIKLDINPLTDEQHFDAPQNVISSAISVNFLYFV